MPMDIEWARQDGRFLIVQARPITTLRGQAAPAEEWNDSLRGDYLWTSGNVGEAVPDADDALHLVAGQDLYRRYHGHIGRRRPPHDRQYRRPILYEPERARDAGGGRLA